MRSIVNHKPTRAARRVSLLAISVVLSAAFFVPAPSALAAPVYGVSFLNEPPASDYAKMGVAGAQVVRTVLSWPDVQPDRNGALKWNAFDRVVRNAAKSGVEVLPILYGVPDWAVDCGNLSKLDCRRVPPIYSSEARAAWQHFVSAAVERYGPNGSFWTSRIPPLEVPTLEPGQLPDVPSLGPPPYTPITRWQVWNEPSSPTYWKPHMPDAKEYGRLVVLTDEAIAASDPSATVLLAGLFGTPFGGQDRHLIVWRFLARMYRVAGIAQHFDAVSLHPYAPNIRGIALQLRRVRRVMARNGDDAKPVWITEIGWGSADPSTGPLLKGPDGQAAELTRAFNRLSAHTRWNVQGVLWFDWRDPGSFVDGCTSPFCLSAGLLAPNGRAKPAYSAFASAAGGTG